MKFGFYNDIIRERYILKFIDTLVLIWDFLGINNDLRIESIIKSNIEYYVVRLY